MSRPLTTEQIALLNHLSRTADPDQEAAQQFDYLLETSAITRKAFAAERQRLLRFAALCRSRRRDLPAKLAEALDELRAPSNAAKTRRFSSSSNRSNREGDMRFIRAFNIYAATQYSWATAWRLAGDKPASVDAPVRTVRHADGLEYVEIPVRFVP